MLEGRGPAAVCGDGWNERAVSRLPGPRRAPWTSAVNRDEGKTLRRKLARDQFPWHPRPLLCPVCGLRGGRGHADASHVTAGQPASAENARGALSPASHRGGSRLGGRVRSGPLLLRTQPQAPGRPSWARCSWTRGPCPPPGSVRRDAPRLVGSGAAVIREPFPASAAPGVNAVAFAVSPVTTGRKCAAGPCPARQPLTRRPQASGALGRAGPLGGPDSWDGEDRGHGARGQGRCEERCH